MEKKKNQTKENFVEGKIVREGKTIGKPVSGLNEIDKTAFHLFGGKAANLGELSKIDDIQVPDGFCISTGVFKKMVGKNRSVNGLINQLSGLRLEDVDKIRILSLEIRDLIKGMAIPGEIAEEINRFLAGLGENNAYAIRSSATAEDLPHASFAGQQDSYLNVKGRTSIFEHISQCWASLFTDRAIIYRMQKGFDQRQVALSVIVQKMIFPKASGILFTADPLSGNRKLLTIDAGFGLGEALVSGISSADVFTVRGTEIIDRKMAAKKMSTQALREGGTETRAILPEQQNIPALTDAQILHLANLGRRIEAHFDGPQDIEWCLADEDFYFVQSRPITTLFPIPKINDDKNHVFISVGHQQMMTDPIKPLGLSFFQLIASHNMPDAAGRLFVDVSTQLSSPDSRATLIKGMGQHDPLIKDAILTIIERKGFSEWLPDEGKASVPRKSGGTPAAHGENDPAVIPGLIAGSQSSLSVLKENIQTVSGSGLFDFILNDIRELRNILFNAQTLGLIIAGVNASTWINEKMKEWLGEKNTADMLSQSVPNNITSEMGLALLDVADAIRPYPEVIDYLQGGKNEALLNELSRIKGGRESQKAIHAFLEKYGMRCPGEIDITRPRWIEKPAMLMPTILSHIKNFEPGASHQKFEKGLKEALKKEQDLLDRLKLLPGGEEKVRETKEMIRRFRNLIGYREYPKYDMISRYLLYKQALLKEAEKLVSSGVLQHEEDVFYLRFEEFRDLVAGRDPDYQVIGNRKEDYQLFEKLVPPRVITSDGEIVSGKYHRKHLPNNALAGLPVSAGIVEGRARVILKMEDADIKEGEILITRFTDPSWTPLFISISGLVTEVGGLMTHGAVIAREYGLPAIVGVENATLLIKDGDRIRVNGSDGYVEVGIK